MFDSVSGAQRRIMTGNTQHFYIDIYVYRNTLAKVGPNCSPTPSGSMYYTYCTCILKHSLDLTLDNDNTGVPVLEYIVLVIGAITILVWC